jgi:tripartite-type tricarboxylate transporter receptor subunit TctC
MKNHATRRGLIAGGASLLGAGLAGGAKAQNGTWPNRPVRILVGFGAGGVTDVAIRLMAEALRPSLPQPIVIENRAGASGMLAAGIAARAEPDGHVLIAIPGTITIVPAAMKNLPIDVLKDLEPITLFATSPNVMVVHPSFPARTAAEFVAHARARPPEDIAYASSGIGTTVHFMAGMLERAADIRLRHVPYRSSNESIQAVIAGEPKVVFSSINSALPHIQSGAVRALGVSSERRSDFLPEVPTFAEQGVQGVLSQTWFGLAGPANMPRPLVERIAGLFNGALRDPALRQRLAALGAEPVGLGPDEFRALMVREVDEFRSLGAAMGLQPV